MDISKATSNLEAKSLNILDSLSESLSSQAKFVIWNLPLYVLRTEERKKGETKLDAKTLGYVFEEKIHTWPIGKFLFKDVLFLLLFFNVV